MCILSRFQSVSSDLFELPALGGGGGGGGSTLVHFSTPCVQYERTPDCDEQTHAPTGSPRINLLDKKRKKKKIVYCHTREIAVSSL